MANKKSDIDNELDRLMTFQENGGGYGDPEAKEADERKIQILMHRQMQKVSNQNNKIAILNVVIAIINIGILIFQLFFK